MCISIRNIKNSKFAKAEGWGAAGILPPYRRKEKGEGRPIRNHLLEAGFSGSQNHHFLDNE
jgi:hypothetical protein